MKKNIKWISIGSVIVAVAVAAVVFQSQKEMAATNERLGIASSNLSSAPEESSGGRTPASVGSAAVGDPDPLVRTTPGWANLTQFMERKYELRNGDEVFYATYTSDYKTNLKKQIFQKLQLRFDSIFPQVLSSIVSNPNQFLCLIDASTGPNAIKAAIYVYLSDNSADCLAKAHAFNASENVTSSRVHFGSVVASGVTFSAEKIYTLYEEGWRAAAIYINNQAVYPPFPTDASPYVDPSLYPTVFVDNVLEGYIMKLAIADITPKIPSQIVNN